MKTITLGLLTSAAACLSVPTGAQTLDRKSTFGTDDPEHAFLLDAQSIATAGRDPLSQPHDEPINLKWKGGLSSSTFSRLATAGLTHDVASEENKQPREPIAGEPRSDRRKQQTSRIEEVIVTAQKSEQRLLDVPVPVTAIAGVNLVENNQLRIQDYYSSVPGLSVSPSPSAFAPQMLAIRGVTTGFNTIPTVGISVDDVPYGSSGRALGSVVPDIDPSNLARIEVLRGPQGVLYGASSMGGLLKFVTVDPSTEGFSGRVEGGLVSVHNGDEPGYNVRGSVNVPLTDTIAVRASGFDRRDAGYIDNPISGVQGINTVHAAGGQMSALWRPTEALSIKLSALYQELTADGSSDVTALPGLGELQQNYLPGAGANKRTSEAYSAVVNASVGAVKITSVTGYNVNEVYNEVDASSVFAPTAQQYFGVRGVPINGTGTTRKFSQEVRVSLPMGEKVEWMMGAFYTHEDAPFKQDIWAADPASGARVGLIATGSPAGLEYEEYAAFTNLTLTLTDRFDIQFGGRKSDVRLKNTSSIGQSVITGYQPTVNPETRSQERPFTYLLTPRYKVSPDLMIYARFASGYRAGGANAFQPPTIPNYDPNIPLGWETDETRNYELGIKGEFLGQVLSLDASAYYIDWTDIQISLTSPVNTRAYTTNGGSAKSQGIELALAARPLAGVEVTTWINWNDATLTDRMPLRSTAYGLDGDRLPYSSRLSGHLSISKEFPISNAISALITGTMSYVDDREGTFTTTPLRPHYPSYTTANLRVGIENGSWSATLFANNIADKRALLGGGPGTFPAFAFNYIQPRTVGLSVAKTF